MQAGERRLKSLASSQLSLERGRWGQRAIFLADGHPGFVGTEGETKAPSIILKQATTHQLGLRTAGKLLVVQAGLICQLTCPMPAPTQGRAAT